MYEQRHKGKWFIMLQNGFANSKGQICRDALWNSAFSILSNRPGAAQIGANVAGLNELQKFPNTNFPQFLGHRHWELQSELLRDLARIRAYQGGSKIVV